MNTFLKRLSLFAALIFTSLLYAEEAEDAVKSVEKPDPKQIQMSVKKKKRIRKIKSKAEFQISEGGIDYMRDDKTDNVELTVTVDNKNKLNLTNYTIVVELYAKSAVDRRAKPTLYKNLAAFIPEIESRNKYQKKFEFKLTYDKSEDIYEKSLTNDSTRKEHGKIYTQPAFGKMFYGYRVMLLDDKAAVTNTVLWPSSLKKVLEKIKEKQQ